MDVTSMLNSSAAAAAASRKQAESAGPTPTPSVIEGTTACSSLVPTPSPEKTPPRRTSVSRGSNRSRTPWDAGGYSLGLTLDTKTTQPTARSVPHSVSPVDSASPESLRHKFSDSHSSLSSYTSSVNSATHSRFSSMSTVSGFQMGTAMADMQALDAGACENLDSAVSRMSVMDTVRSKRDGGFSPSMIAEEPSMVDVGRPGSPSDAMLMSRGSQGLDRMSPQETANPRDLRSDFGFLAPPELSKVHKRALSAPDFVAIGGIDQAYPPLPQTFQPTPPPSQHGDRRSSYAMDAFTGSPTNNMVALNSSDIKCMYVDNCDTGSQPRKAISHIFGRNKLCTRMIPQHVWVHFCRKHYQRSRYRNAQEYAKLQCELVQKQIQRVQAWSDENKRAGNSGVVQDWSLSVRKREQKRLDDKTSTGKKRPYPGESEEEDDTIDRAVLNGTAVPAWLLNKCGNGYSTRQIEEVVAQLKSEMDHNNLTQIPDIEILPNISTDAPEDGKNKMVVKRKPSTGSIHKRSQSVGVALPPPPMIRRHSQQSYYEQRSSPIEKRQRTADFAAYGRPMGLAQVPERSVPTNMGRMHHQLPHRPAFSHIREAQNEETYYNTEDDGRGSHYSLTGPLPAPAPVRYTSQPMASQLEVTSNSPSNYMDARRGMHQRSQSEMGGFHQNSANFTFRSSPSSYPPLTNQGYAEPNPYDSSYLRTDPSFTATGPPGYYDDMMPAARQYEANNTPIWGSPNPHGHNMGYTPVRHSRHQSTPTVPQVVPRISPASHEMPTSAPRPMDLHRTQSTFVPRLTDQAKAMYAERR